MRDFVVLPMMSRRKAWRKRNVAHHGGFIVTYRITGYPRATYGSWRYITDDPYCWPDDLDERKDWAMERVWDERAMFVARREESE